jgi:hypothetical protein
VFGNKYELENALKITIDLIKQGLLNYEETLKTIPEDLKQQFIELYNK